jgi:choline-sulfatase
MFMIRERPADRTRERFLAWLNTWHDQKNHQPFFSWIHFFDPHQPDHPHARRGYLTPTPYDGEIATVDDAVGDIYEALQSMGLLDQTIVVITADHGESLGEHQEKTHGVFVYDATIKVPLLWRYPKLLSGGRVYSGPTRPIDLMPTILALAGLKGGEQTQGTNLLPALRGETPPPELPQYCESMLAELGFGMAPLFGLRDHGYKYVRAPKPELYDLAKDPRELTNIIAQNPRLAADMDQRLTQILAQAREKALPATANPMDKETEDMLLAVGYLTPADARKQMNGIDPKDGIGLRDRLEDARHAVQLRQWPKAETLLKAIVQESPNNVSARNVLALAYQQTGEPEKARAEYPRSLAVDPQQSRIFAALGSMAFVAGDLAQAKAHFNRALAMAPSYVEVVGFLGWIAVTEGDRGQAEQLFAHARQLDPSFPNFFKRVGDWYFTRGQFATALHSYERLLAYFSEHYAGLVQASLTAFRLDDFPRAWIYQDLAGQTRPDQWLPPYHLAWLATKVGDVEAGEHYLSLALDAGFARADRPFGGARKPKAFE